MRKCLAFVFLFWSPLVLARSGGPSFPQMTLADATGKTHEIGKAISSTKGTVFIAHGNSCPIFRQLVPEINRLIRIFSKQNIKTYLVNANLQNSKSDILEEIKMYPVHAPVLVDSNQVLARHLNLQVTTDSVLIGQDGQPVYHGAIDNQFNYEGARKTEIDKYLLQAVNAYIAGRSVDLNGPRALGCAITYKSQAKSH